MDAKQNSLLSQLGLLAVNVIATTRSTLAALEQVSLSHLHGECSKHALNCLTDRRPVLRPVDDGATTGSVGNPSVPGQMREGRPIIWPKSKPVPMCLGSSRVTPLRTRDPPSRHQSSADDGEKKKKKTVRVEVGNMLPSESLDEARRRYEIIPPRWSVAKGCWLDIGGSRAGEPLPMPI